MNREFYDKIIIGAGLYGLYAAWVSAGKGQRVLVLEYDPAPFTRATYVNQARVHMGYHYPRSLTTAVKSADYFNRFATDFSFCIHQEFEQIYAISSQFSWTSGSQFVEFCHASDIPCEEVPVSRYFKKGMCEGAYLTREYTYDAKMLGQYFMEQLASDPHVDFIFGARIARIEAIGRADKADSQLGGNQGKQRKKQWEIGLEDGQTVTGGFLCNATYASANQVLSKVFQSGGGEEKTTAAKTKAFPIKYELCEIILCRPSAPFQKIGITVMDGPFFSIMPFGKTGFHSLTSVTFTPHMTSYQTFPTFDCQGQNGNSCTPGQLGNCNHCPDKPASMWSYMSHLADKYLKEEYAYEYERSLFSMKPILKSSEVDDSRPTAIRVISEDPPLISVLSGKINTVYDLDDYL